MKNWKCIIVSIILTPVCLALIFGFAIGLSWIIESCIALQFLGFGIFGLISIVSVYYLLYNFCMSYMKKRAERWKESKQKEWNRIMDNFINDIEG